MEAFNNIVTAINGVVWGPIMLVLLIGTHCLLTARTKFINGPPNITIALCLLFLAPNVLL